MSFLSKSKTESRSLLDPATQAGLQSAITSKAGYVSENQANEQNMLNALLNRYESGELDSVLNDYVREQSGMAQQKMLGQAVTKAGSAFNTAAQSAAQRATATATSEIAMNAEKARQEYLSNLLDQYGNQTADYMNLLNTLAGSQQTIQKTKQGWGGLALTTAGTVIGALAGGPAGAMAGAQIGSSTGQALNRDR